MPPSSGLPRCTIPTIPAVPRAPRATTSRSTPTIPAVPRAPRATTCLIALSIGPQHHARTQPWTGGSGTRQPTDIVIEGDRSLILLPTTGPDPEALELLREDLRAQRRAEEHREDIRLYSRLAFEGIYYLDYPNPHPFFA